MPGRLGAPSRARAARPRPAIRGPVVLRARGRAQRHRAGHRAAVAPGARGRRAPPRGRPAPSVDASELYFANALSQRMISYLAGCSTPPAAGRLRPVIGQPVRRRRGRGRDEARRIAPHHDDHRRRPAHVDFYADLLGLRLVKTTVNVDRAGGLSPVLRRRDRRARLVLPGFSCAARPGIDRPDDPHRPARRRRPASARLLGRAAEAGPGRIPSASAPTRPCALRSGRPRARTGRRRPGQPAAGGRPPRGARRARHRRAAGCARLSAAARPPGICSSVTALGFTGLGRRRVPAARRQPPVRLGLRRAARPQPDDAGAGTVHHIAWASPDDEHLDWRGACAWSAPAPSRSPRSATATTSRSVSFREPRGVLFEIATLSPGFAVDEDPEHLGEQLTAPPAYEHLRAQLARTLTPLTNPRARRRRPTGA